jgi:5-methylcytosine-specific restriction endonuclease McrA
MRGRTWVKSRVSDQRWAQVFRADALTEQGGACCYCYEPLTSKTVTADHVRPRIKGGVTERKNIKASCRACNMAKSAMTPTGFVAAIKYPKPGDSIHIWFAHYRRRIFLATARACERIRSAA